MPSTTISVLASAMFIVATVASPLSPAPMINAGCTGKILNLLSFKSNQCNNTDNTTPFLWNQKFTAQPGETTRCTKINIDGGVVNSFVYTNDGIDNGTCTLQLYKSDTCTDIPRTDFGVTDMASDCKTQTFRAVKLQCD